MTNKNVCPKCGQIYDAEMAKCPLCGAVSPATQTEQPTVLSGRGEGSLSADEKRALRREEEEFLRAEEGRYRRMKRRGETDAPEEKDDSRIPAGFLAASIVILIAALMIGGSFLLWKANVLKIGLYDRLAGRTTEPTVTTLPSDTVPDTGIGTEPTATAQPDTEPTEPTEETQPQIVLPFAFDADDPVLILVDEDNPIPDDFPVDDMATLGTGARVNRLCMEDLQSMVSTCRLANHYPGVYEGYDETAKATSEYRTGLAVDIFPETDQARDAKTQSESETLQWLWEHCWEYGFIIRYPEGKEDLTGHDYEPWHFRYVGKSVAEYMHEEDLCFEEMSELLKRAAQ